MKNSRSPEGLEVPLCVDLDGTLVRSDLLVESAFALLRQNLLFCLLFPFWLLGGKCRLKAEIAKRIVIDASLLPYNETLLEDLRRQHDAGRCLVIATASNERLAQAVADHLGLFSSVRASDDKINLSGPRKRDCLVELYGRRGFDYAGNDKADLVVWDSCDRAILVEPGAGVERSARKTGRVSKVIAAESSQAAGLLRAVRPHQWLKNVLVFVPLVLAQRFLEPQILFQALLAFVSFCLCASSVYLLNDLVDLESDRLHPTKRHRPFASGQFSIWNGLRAIPLLLLGAFGIAGFLPVEFLLVLVVYYCATIAYSFRLKRVALIDVLTLGGLYTLRIIGGAAAVQVVTSSWLLAFSMFLFLSLALAKRYTELYTLKKESGAMHNTRGYRREDLDILSHFGVASAFSAVLVLALYINSDTIRQIYAYPEAFWVLCPLMLYLISRIWLLAHRGELHEDPVIFVMRDGRSIIMVMLGALVLLAAMVPWG